MARPHFAFLDYPKPVAIAHRGGNAAGAEKENSMAAFEAAYELGYCYMETDTVLSLDGVVLATHGSQIRAHERKTGLPLRRYLQTLSFNEIQRPVSEGGIRIGGEPIPALGEVLESFPDVRFNIDPKTREVVRPLGRLLLEHNAIDRVCIGATSYSRTKGVAEEVGGQSRICTGMGPLGLIAVKTGWLPDYLRASEAAILYMPFRAKDLTLDSNDATKSNRPLLTMSTMERARDAGLDVQVWTVNDQPSMEAALATGVDGIMSDEVVLLKEAMTP